MKAEKLKSGRYRARAYDYTDDKGKKHYKSFTSNSKKEAERMATDYEARKNYYRKPDHITLGETVDKYIEDCRGTRSEATVYGYEKIRRVAFPDLFLVYTDKLTPEMLQYAVKVEKSRGVSNKTVYNRYGLVRAALRKYYPKLDTNVKIPKKVKKINKLPEPDEVVRAVKGTNVELPVLLAMWLSFTLSEMKGLKHSSIYGDYIQIDQVVVYAGGRVEKDLAKAEKRIRRHRLPPYIKDLIDKLPPDQEYLVPEVGQTINNRLKKALDDAGVATLTLHQCRHLFASIALVKLGISSEVVKDEGGWTTDSTVKDVYAEVFNSDRKEADKKIDEYFIDILNYDKKMSYEQFLTKLNISDSDVAKNMYENYKEAD